MPTSGVGAELAALKAERGLTWAELGELIGTTGEYARKVAAGKGGASYARQVAELRARGVTTPATRRRTSSGELAKVRGRRGEPSRVPVEPAVRAAQTRLLGQRGRLVRVEVPVFPYAGSRKAKEAAREARQPAKDELMRVLRSAAQGRRRVAFHVGNGTTAGEVIWTDELGGKGGYAASDVLRRARGEGGDVLAWLGDDDELEADEQEGEVQKVRAGSYGKPPDVDDDLGGPYGVSQVDVIVLG